ncbi:hypothetical protein L336_0019 [Candidatus Saccharimonas aalborgensis]|jgi:hypothetical protein|uniref:Uncharacterized protein n=1 Tax=Candidatus Saccharimonas aalborgensis TaxID=1332188 RepID=R4PX41_9BACT|nr:hypothetical protein [Candidatus Saccharimonas aalborgensis]MBP7775299.1 hypothetical protein [Candidatus Saccharimonas sp.]QQR51531.1 MAG: hypothetical protein IPF89_01710 [Candidatus Saccharibacteria bacterium]AGL61731.1 hypothetical protein L336_0019 [Candidatus Saccharimonas aalborgensis]QQS68262.1 MAG: hypothetical protein IPP24_04615 [Candidatus Saccharibacteria bacterium]QQS70586.1 MAG: hypothetical protein IPP92_04620 [Candidatus Saccharibacteria bacterium]
MNNQPPPPISQDDFTTPSALPPTDPLLGKVRSERRWHPHRAKLLLIGVIATVTLIVIGTFLLFGRPTPKNTVEQPQTRVDTVPDLTAAETIIKLRSVFKGSALAPTPPSVPIQTANHNYYTVVTDPSEVAKTSLSGPINYPDTDEIIVSIKSVFETNHFSPIVLKDGGNNASVLIEYTRKDVVCQLDVSSPTTVKPITQSVSVSCLDMKQYETLARAQEPFYRAYSPALTASYAIALIGAPSVKNGGTAGYQTAIIAVGTVAERTKVTGGVTPRFYAASDQVWHYFTDRVGDLTCDIYATNDIKTAYAGTPCYSTASKKMSVVKAPNTK